MNGNVALTINKLPGICGDLVCNDEDWQSLDFLQLCAALKSWTRCHPGESNSLEPLPKFDHQSLQPFNTRQHGVKPCACVYFEENSHKSADCPRVATLDGRKKILAEKNWVLTVLGQGTGQRNV